MKTLLSLLAISLFAQLKAQSIIWSDEFETPGNWIAAGPNGHNPPDFGWSVGHQTNSWYNAFQTTMGTTGSFARFRNGNTINAINGGPFTFTYANTIDLSAHPHVMLEFDQYGARFMTLHAVQISLDGVVWTTVITNNDITPLTVQSGSVFPLSMPRLVNITPFLNGNTEQVRVRLLWDGALNGGMMNYIDYGWYVDNIRFTVAPDNYLTLTENTYGIGALNIPYTRFPISQMSDSIPIYFKAKITNSGSTTQNATLQINLPDTTLLTTAQNLLSNDSATFVTDTLNFSTLMPDLNEYSIHFQAESGVPLFFPNDASADRSLEITEIIMAQDRYNGNLNSLNGAFTGWASPTGDPSIGLRYEIFEDCNLSIIQTKLGNVGVANQNMYIGNAFHATLWKWDEINEDYLFMQISEEHIITQADFGTEMIKLNFETAQQFQAGDQLAAFITFNELTPAPIAYSGYTKAGNTIGLNGSTFVTMLAVGDSVLAPVVRLDFTDYPFEIVAETTPATCESNCDGSVEFILSGLGATAGPFTISWFYEGNPINILPPNFAQNLCPGNYTVQMQNPGHTTSVDFTITAPYAIDYTLEFTPYDCLLNQLPNITVIPNGDPADFNILWMNGSTDFTLTDALTTQDNSFVLSDNLGCSLQSEDLLPPAIEPDFDVNFIATSPTMVDQAVTFVVNFQNLTPNPSAYQFTWNFWGNSVTTQEEFVGFPIISVTPGFYDVSLTATDVNGCAQTITNPAYIEVTNSVGLSQEETFEIGVFPNPSNGVFNFELSENGLFEITVLDNTGRIIQQMKISSSNATLDLSKHDAGLYAVKISRIDVGQSTWLKLIKH